MPTTAKTKSQRAAQLAPAPAHTPAAVQPASPPEQLAPPAFMAETMRLADFARRYKISLPTAYDWMDPEKTTPPLPSFKIGRERLVHLPTADAWVHARLTGGASQ
jgi:hypothetical protein